MWELQSHMHSYIAPSILKFAQEREDPLGWLCEHVACKTVKDSECWATKVAEIRAQYADAEGKPIYWGPLVEKLTKVAIEYGATTNGGKEFYLDGWTHIPWCDEETMLEYYS